jgi:hypothetical protein
VSKEPEEDGALNPTFDGWWRLYRSQDFGQTFSLAQSGGGFTWGVDGYGPGLQDNYCDVWVPWVSNSYAGGAVFWTTTCLQEADVFANQEYVPLIFRSLNHGLSYTNIGNDGGDLDHGLNILKGPYNSLDRVYGALTTQDAIAGDANTVYTWLDGGQWTEFRNVAAAGNDDCRNLIILSQSGYTLSSALAFTEPYTVTSGSETDKQRPNDGLFDACWIIP